MKFLNSKIYYISLIVMTLLQSSDYIFAGGSAVSQAEILGMQICARLACKISGDLRPCSRCQSIYYCSPACQFADWPTHRSNCCFCFEASEDEQKTELLFCSGVNCKKSEDLKACSQCESIYYCSKECQLADWSNHKKTCRPRIKSSEDEQKIELPVCSGVNCKKSENLKACRQCESIYYCSRECQLADWPNHKQTCRPRIKGSKDEQKTELLVCSGVDCKKSEGLNPCTRCNSIYYCSRACQIADWPNHRQTCHARLEGPK